MATRRPRPEDSIPLECGLSRYQIRLLHETISTVIERRRKAPETTPALSKKNLRALLGPDPIALLLRLRDELRLLNTPLDLAYLEASGARHPRRRRLVPRPQSREASPVRCPSHYRSRSRLH